MRSPVRWLLALLVALHLAAAWNVAFNSDWTVPDFATGDNRRFREIAAAPGVPYRDADIEYPPLGWLYLELIGAPDDVTTGGRLLVLTQLVADLAVAAALAYGWGRRTAVAWLVLMLPLCWEGWIYGRFDLLAVALAMWGLALARRHRETLGGALVGLSAFVKAWPIVTVPGLAVEHRPRALRTSLLTLLIGGLGWLALGGPSGVAQVVSFRGATGWQVESTVGSVLLLDATRPSRSESGALRIGEQPGWAKVVLAVLLLGGIVIAWLLARRAARSGGTSPAEAAVLGNLVCVGLLLVLSPLLSPQYLVWLLPFVAIRWRDWLITGLMAASLVLSALVARNYGQLLNHGTGWGLLVLVRNGLLVAIVGLGFQRLVRSHRAIGSLGARPTATK